jgi:hypothetical protein
MAGSWERVAAGPQYWQGSRSALVSLPDRIPHSRRRVATLQQGRPAADCKITAQQTLNKLTREAKKYKQRQLAAHTMMQMIYFSRALLTSSGIPVSPAAESPFRQKHGLVPEQPWKQFREPCQHAVQRFHEQIIAQTEYQLEWHYGDLFFRIQYPFSSRSTAPFCAWRTGDVSCQDATLAVVKTRKA